MRIAYVSASRIPSSEANSVAVMQMCNALVGAGHEVVLFARPGAAGHAVDPHEHYGVSSEIQIETFARRRPLGSFRYLWWLRRRLRELRTQAVYGRDPVGLLASWRLGAPAGYEIHHPPLGYRRALVERLLIHGRIVGVVVFISRSLREEYLRRYTTLPESTVVAPSAAVIPSLPGAPSCDTSSVRVGYLGNLYGGKGGDVVLALASRCPDLQFHVVGGTADQLAPTEKTTLPVNLVVHGVIPHRDITRWIVTFDIAVAPYHTSVEPSGGGDIAKWMSPLKLVEYMAHGRAIIASDLPAVRELVDESCAILCPPGDVDAWTRELRALAADPDRRRRLGEVAQERQRNTLTWDLRARLVVKALSFPAIA